MASGGASTLDPEFELSVSGVGAVVVLARAGSNRTGPGWLSSLPVRGVITDVSFNAKARQNNQTSHSLLPTLRTRNERLINRRPWRTLNGVATIVNSMPGRVI